MTTERDQHFILTETFNWHGPITAAAQTAVATYGNDDDRIRLIAHDSVTAESLEALSQVPSIDVRVAVAGHAATPLAALASLTRDRVRAVKTAAHQTIEDLPEERRLAARTLAESPIQRLKSRRFGPRAA